MASEEANLGDLDPPYPIGVSASTSRTKAVLQKNSGWRKRGRERISFVGVDRALLFHLATSERFERAVKAIPGGEAGAWRAASRYVAGRTRDEALATGARLLEQGLGVSIDLFGERVSDPSCADRALEEYLLLTEVLPPPPADVWLSVDLSHLALDVDPSAVADRLAAIAAMLPVGRRIQVGAEDASRADAILRCVTEVASRGLADRLGATIQANLLRSPADVEMLIGTGVHIRLVKGAYLEETGAHPHGEPTDIAFLRLGFYLRQSDASWSLATHDGRVREALLLGPGTVPVEQLFGVRPQSLYELRDRGIPTRVYLPYGPDWFRYWMRRLAESRGA